MLPSKLKVNRRTKRVCIVPIWMVIVIWDKIVVWLQYFTPTLNGWPNTRVTVPINTKLKAIKGRSWPHGQTSSLKTLGPTITMAKWMHGLPNSGTLSNSQIQPLVALMANFNHQWFFIGKMAGTHCMIERILTHTRLRMTGACVVTTMIIDGPRALFGKVRRDRPAPSGGMHGLLKVSPPFYPWEWCSHGWKRANGLELRCMWMANSVVLLIKMPVGLLTIGLVLSPSNVQLLSRASLLASNWRTLKNNSALAMSWSSQPCQDRTILRRHHIHTPICALGIQVLAPALARSTLAGVMAGGPKRSLVPFSA